MSGVDFGPWPTQRGDIADGLQDLAPEAYDLDSGLRLLAGAQTLRWCDERERKHDAELDADEIEMLRNAVSDLEDDVANREDAIYQLTRELEEARADFNRLVESLED